MREDRREADPYRGQCQCQQPVPVMRHDHRDGTFWIVFVIALLFCLPAAPFMFLIPTRTYWVCYNCGRLTRTG